VTRKVMKNARVPAVISSPFLGVHDVTAEGFSLPR